MNFDHKSLSLKDGKNLVYTAFSKKMFYFRMHISKFVIEQNKVPLNPFMSFDYFLLDTVNRDQVREANNNLVKRADELWVFGPVSNGVLAEIKLASEMKKQIKYFKIENSIEIIPVSSKEVEMEEEVMEFKSELPM